MGTTQCKYWNKHVFIMVDGYTIISQKNYEIFHTHFTNQNSVGDILFSSSTLSPVYCSEEMLHNKLAE